LVYEIGGRPLLVPTRVRLPNRHRRADGYETELNGIRDLTTEMNGIRHLTTELNGIRDLRGIDLSR
jgi:hypothetical protein